MKKTYVRLLYIEGDKLSKDSPIKWYEREVNYIDPKLVIEDLPGECYGFKFFQRQELETNNKEILKGEPKDLSGIFYLGGWVIEDCKKAPNEFLAYLMFLNGIEKAVIDRFGSIHPFDSFHDTLVRKSDDLERAKLEGKINSRYGGSFR